MTSFAKVILTVVVTVAMVLASPGAEMSRPEEGPEVHVYYHDVPIPRNALPPNSHYQVGDRIVPEVQVGGAAEVYHHPPGTHNEPMPSNWQIHIPDIPQLSYDDHPRQQLLCGPQGCLPAPPVREMQEMSLGSDTSLHQGGGMMPPTSVRGRASPSRMQRGRASPRQGYPSNFNMPPQQHHGLDRDNPMVRPAMIMHQGPPPQMRGREGARGRMSPLGRGLPMHQGTPMGPNTPMGERLPMRPRLSPHPRIEELQDDSIDLPPPMRTPSRRASPSHSPAHSARNSRAPSPAMEGADHAPSQRRPSSRSSSRAPSVHDEQQ